MSPVGAKEAPLNAIGLNQYDGMVYGIRNGYNPVLVKVGPDGIQIPLGTISGLPAGGPKGYVAGEWDPGSGKLIVSSGATAEKLYAIDLGTRVATPITVPSNVQLAGGIGQDIAIYGNTVWAVNQAKIVGVDLSDGTGTVIPLPKGACGSAPPALFTTSGNSMAWVVHRAVGDVVWSVSGWPSTGNVNREGLASISLGHVTDGAFAS